MTPRKYIAYYRVSTDKQKKSGLGLEAQVDSVDHYIQQSGRELIASYREVVSTVRKCRKLAKAPVLDAALAHAKAENATLVVAKLDRLKRDLYFIAGLQKDEIPFVALDIPEADEFTIHIFAAFAQREGKIISKRTKEGLAVRKAKGLPMGNPQNLRPEFSHLSRVEAAVARETQARLFAEKMRPTLSYYLQNRYSLNKIASEMNRLQYQTPSGLVGKWTATTVKNCLAWVA